MKIRHTLLSTLIVALLLGGCSSYHVRQGNRLYNQLAYSEAVQEYEKALGKKMYPEAQRKLADSYRLMNQWGKSEQAYAKVMGLSEAQPVDRLRYGQLLMRSGKYEQARTYLDQYLGSVAGDEAARRMRQSCDSIEYWKKDSARYTLGVSELNTGQVNFSPVYYKEGIVFVTDRSMKGSPKTYSWTSRPYLDLYYARLDVTGKAESPRALQGVLNGIYHEGPSVFTQRGDTGYLTRNNYVKKKVGKSSQDVVNLKLYQVTKKDTSWSGIQELPFNSDDYSTGHPALSRDGQTLYFSSDRPGGQGGADLYVSRKVNGAWSQPENLGSVLNTSGNELFPYLWQDTVLYYSSEGLHGMGGLDVYRSVRGSTGWSRPENLGYPLNTHYDDFGIALNDSATAGFVSSNRGGNTGIDQIYALSINDLRFTLEGIAVMKSTQAPLEGVVVELLNKKTGKKETLVTGPDGKFLFRLDPETEYSVVGSKDGYFTNTEPVSTVGKVRSENMYVKLKLEMEQIVINKPIVLENIYYDLDKWDIRSDAAQELDKLVQTLVDNPGIRIELSSHTDSRADDRYNDVLSQKRAESAVQYLVSKGIDRSRMSARGYGEQRLVNGCSNGVECTEEQHQANRRTEFKVTEMTK
jgi:peptidoglycan-associated lipoprotein